MPLCHKAVHLPVKECQEKRANVRSVNVGVCHDHDLVVPPLGEIGCVANPSPDGRDHAADFLVGKHLVFAALVGIDDLAPQRQDRLILSPATSFSTAAGGITLDKVELAPIHIATRAIAQLPRQSPARQGSLPFPQEGPGLLGCCTGLGCQNPLKGNRLCTFWILLEILTKEFTDCGIDDAFHFAVAELCFCLPFKLRVRHSHADNDGEPLSHILTSRHEIFVNAAFFSVCVQAASQCRTETRDVRASFSRRNIIDIAVEIFRELTSVL